MHQEGMLTIRDFLINLKYMFQMRLKEITLYQLKKVNILQVMEDVVEFSIERTNVRRVKLKFIDVNENCASLNEISFYKTDELADKIGKALFNNKL